MYNPQKDMQIIKLIINNKSSAMWNNNANEK